MENIELKPCPFCGGMADFEKDYFCTKSYFWVKCTECGARIASVEESLYYCAKDKAIELWNKRRTDDEFNNNNMQ